MNFDKKELLLVSARFPYPLHKGDQLVLFNNIRLMSDTYSITLLTMYDEESELENIDKLKLYCKEIITVKRNKLETYFNLLISPLKLEPLQVAYYRNKHFKILLDELISKNKFDIVHVYMLRMAHYAIDLPTFKVISLVDSMALNMQRRVENESGLKKLIFKYESFLVKDYETKMVKRFNKAIVVSNIDKDYIGEKNIEVIPIGVNIQQSNTIKEDKKIIFSGNMGYFPNQNAVIWFIENCFEEIKKAIPEIKFFIVGKNPPEKIMKYQDGLNIFVKGYVDSMIDELASATIAIAPMQSGSGMQIKILESMSVGLPIVATELGRGDISAIHNEHILIANEPEEFVNECISLIKNKSLQESIGSSAKYFVENNHAWQRIEKQYINIYEVKK